MLSDILHNFGAVVKNASLFRTHIQAALPGLLDELNVWKRAHLQGRMSLTHVEERVQGELAAWLTEPSPRPPSSSGSRRAAAH